MTSWSKQIIREVFLPFIFDVHWGLFSGLINRFWNDWDFFVSTEERKYDDINVSLRTRHESILIFSHGLKALDLVFISLGVLEKALLYFVISWLKGKIIYFYEKEQSLPQNVLFPKLHQLSVWPHFKPKQPWHMFFSLNEDSVWFLVTHWDIMTEENEHQLFTVYWRSFI